MGDKNILTFSREKLCSLLVKGKDILVDHDEHSLHFLGGSEKRVVLLQERDMLPKLSICVQKSFK